MSQAAAIIATLGIEKGKFRTDLEAAKSDLGGLKTEATATAGAIAVLERSMKSAGGGTAEQKSQITALKGEYRDLTREIKTTEAQMKSLAAAAPPALPAPPPPSRPYADIRQAPADPATAPGGHGAGNGRMRSMELGHSARAFTDMMMAGQNPMQAAQMEVPRIVQAYGGGIGTIIGIGAITGLIAKLTEAFEAAKKLREEFSEAGRSMGSMSGASEKALAPRLEESRGMLGKIREAMGSKLANVADLFRGPQGLGEGVMKIFGGGPTTGEKERAGMEAAELARQKVIYDRMMSVESHGTAINRRGFEQGDSTVARARLDHEEAQRRDEINQKAGDGLYPESAKALANLKEEFALRREILARTQAGKAAETTLETTLIGIKRQGLDIEVASAQANFDAAKAATARGPQGGQEHAELAARQDAAALELETAKRSTAERKQHLAIEERLANFRGSADAKHLLALDLERQRLESVWKTAKPDERDKLRVDLAQNRSETYDARKAARDRAFSIEDTRIDSEKGRGPAEELRALDRRLDRNRRQREAPGNDPAQKANLDKEAHDLKTRKEDVLWAEKESLEAARSHTREMALHVTGANQAASAEATRLRYHQEIAAAMREGKTELAEQLRIQQKLTLVGEKVRREMLGPAGRYAEDQRELAQGAALYRVENRERRHAEAEVANGRSNPLLDRMRASWAPDIRAQATAGAGGGPLQQHSTDDSNAGDVVDVLEDVRELLGKCLTNPGN